MREDWIIAKYKDFLDYIQPTKYLVDSTNYDDRHNTPVLTAGKTFILGYTKEEHGIFNDFPVIIFDDFTTASKFVNFKFKAKSSAMKILKPTSELVNIKFIYYTMQMNQINTDTHKRYWISIYSEHSLLTPPLLEQKAIVSKIEQLFSELDNGIENLKTAQQKLKIYRQAILKKAFEGELTKEWREKQNNLPTAEALLEEIQKERGIWIKNEIENNNSEAKRLKNKLNKLEFKIPNENIPDSWKWTSFLESAHLVVDCHNKTAPYVDSGIYLIRTSNIRDGKFDFKNKMKFVNEATCEYWSRRCPPEPGDILFTREAPMGEAAIIPKNTKVCMGQRIMLIRVFKQLLNEKYLLYAILDSKFQQRFGNTSIGTGVKHLRVGDVEKLTFPLCSQQEQTQIVQEIDSRLSVCDNIEATLTDALKKSEALRQSILKKAFEGKLLTKQELEDIKNHPEYESAEKLLERIKQERDN